MPKSNNKVSCKDCNKDLILEKIKIIFELIKKDWNLIMGYLKSKEIWDDLIVHPIFFSGDYVEVQVRSRSTNDIYTVIINFKRDIYYCTCNSYVFKRYPLEIPEGYRPKFWRATIALCPHIIKVIEFLYRKYYSSTK